MMGKRAFDLAIGHVERAQFIPALGIVAEEPRGGGLAALLQGVEPGAVGGDAGMLGVEPAHEFAHQGRVVARRDEAEAGELGLAETLQKACFHEQFQVSGDSGLALSQDVNIVADRQILAGGEGQNAQPRVLGRSAQKGEKMIHGKTNISISLYLQVPSRRYFGYTRVGLRVGTVRAYALQTAVYVCDTPAEFGEKPLYVKGLRRVAMKDPGWR